MSDLLITDRDADLVESRHPLYVPGDAPLVPFQARERSAA